MIAHKILRRCLLRTSNSLLFWLMLFGSAWLHTLRHIRNVCAREKERKPSQQKKVFYRIVRRVISCGKFSFLFVILFNRESRKMRRCQTARVSSLCTTFRDTRCDWSKGKSNKDGRLGAKKGDSGREREQRREDWQDILNLGVSQRLVFASQPRHKASVW